MSTGKKRFSSSSARNIRTALWGLAGPVIMLALYLVLGRTIGEIELKTADLRTRLLGPVKTDPRIVIVAVDDPSLERFGPWPWSRSRQAAIIERIDAYGAKAIIYDFIIASPSKDPVNDENLASAMLAADKVIGTIPLELSYSGAGAEPEISPEERELLMPSLYRVGHDKETPDFPDFSRALFPPEWYLKSAAAMATNPASPDSDGVLRRVPLFVSTRDGLLPVLGLAAVERLGEWDFDGMVMRGSDLIIPAKKNGPADDLIIPVDGQGRSIINWTGPWDAWNTEERTGLFSAQWLIDPDPPDDVAAELARRIKGSLCFVGAAYTGGTDMRSQPFQAAFPGVGIHANLANTIMGRKMKSDAGVMGFIFCLAGLTALSIVIGLGKSPWLSAPAGAFVVALYLGFSIAAPAWIGSFIPVTLPLVSFIIGLGAMITYNSSRIDREAKFLKEHFRNVISPSVLERLLADPKSLQVKGERREISVLFSDIRGFTAISDREDPEVINALLSEYFEAMTEIIFKYSGTLDKFIGDGIMAFWGAPVPSDDHALEAAKAAIEMQRVTKELSRKWIESGWPEIVIRIGIKTGFAGVGFFGSNLHREYTALGSSVNMAQRLESNCTPGNVMISKRTWAMIRDLIECEAAGFKELKGFQDPVEVFEIKCD